MVNDRAIADVISGSIPGVNDHSLHFNFSINDHFKYQNIVVFFSN